MISSILSPFGAVFVTRRKNKMTVMRYLLRFITFLRLHPQVTSLFEKNKQKLMSEANNTGLILYGVIEKVKAIDGRFVYSRENCPLMSTRITQKNS